MPDVRTLLNDDDLAALRKGYSPADMRAGARMAVAAPFPRAVPMVEAIISTFYADDSELAAERREQVLIATMAAKGEGGSRTFAVHLYWGLMVGLSLGDIADTLLLVGAYDGIDRFSNSVNALAALVNDVLRPALALGGDALESTPIVRGIAQRFP